MVSLRKELRIPSSEREKCREEFRQYMHRIYPQSKEYGMFLVSNGEHFVSEVGYKVQILAVGILTVGFNGKECFAGIVEDLDTYEENYVPKDMEVKASGDLESFKEKLFEMLRTHKV